MMRDLGSIALGVLVLIVVVGLACWALLLLGVSAVTG